MKTGFIKLKNILNIKVFNPIKIKKSTSEEISELIFELFCTHSIKSIKIVTCYDTTFKLVTSMISLKLTIVLSSQTSFIIDEDCSQKISTTALFVNSF